MQSLKDLRKASAVRQQLSRTGGDAAESELASSIELGEASGPLAATTGAAGAAGASRVGRTLAPLTSTGSLAQTSSRDDDPTSDGGAPSNKRDDAIQETRRRRRRRRRDREQRRSDDSHHANEEDGAATVPGTSRTSTAVVGEEEGSGFRGGAGFSGRSGGDETSRGQATDEEKSATGPGPPLPLSARGLPPQERPQKKLTPLEARRARIEQQKREEAERTVGTYKNNDTLQTDASHMSSDSREARERPETTSERRSDHPARSSKAGPGGDDGRSSGGYSDGSRREPGSNRTAARKGNNARRGKSDLTNEDEKGVPIDLGGENKEGARDQSDGENAEQDMLIPDTAAAGRTPGGDAAPESAGADAGIARGESGEPAGNKDGGHESPAEGGFKGMRSRMKKAGQGLMNKSSSFRRASSEEKLRGARSKNTDDDQPEGGGGYNMETAPDTAGVVDSAREAGGSTNNVNRGNRGDLPPRNQEDSDMESDGSVMSPMISDAEEEDDHGGGHGGSDAEHKGGTGRNKKKWRRKKGAAEATADGNTEAEVTLGHVVDRKMREMGYIRKPAVENLKNRRALRDRVAAEGAPEVHFIGELSGAEGFGSGISCRFRVEGGRHWTCLAGLEEGQTHVIHADYGETFAPWNHPIDLHYTTKSIQGWPRLMLQVWQLDVHGRNVLRGYGFRHLPSTPGFSEVSVPCWRPTGTMQEETAAFFLGVTPRLTAEDAVFNRAWDQRCRLVTLPAGTVWIQVSGLFRNFQDQGVDSLSFN